MLASFQLFLTLIVFGCAGIQDFLYREVSNKTWLIFTPIGLFLTLLDLTTSLKHLDVFVSIMVTVVFSVFVWVVGGFGGADMKGLITLSLLMPMGFNGSTPFFSLVVLVFSCVIANVHILYTILKRKSVKSLEIPLMTYTFFGIIISLFVGEWFINLIL